MPTKKVVAVKSEADATLMASAPAVARKRTSAKAKPVTEAAAAEVALVSGEKKARSSTKKTTTTAAVTHRHKKQTQQESAAISNTTAVSPVSAETKVAPVAPVLAYEPAGEDVARLAYSYYVARGYQAGDQAADWFRAINELKASHAAASYLLED